jgi:membrane protein YdbS with pleckstrin-like domain
MSQQTERVARWIYGGVWAVLVNWFRVPNRPPSLPGREGEFLDSFQPAPGFLRYLKFYFWVVLLAIDLPLTVGWLLLLLSDWQLGLLVAPVAWFVIVAPDIVAYIAIHLRYDTTWYLITERSLRLRRGIWIIREVTITFENVQNILVRQGPVQRYFGISDLIVLTAGGGATESHGEGGHVKGGGHRGIIEGISAAKARQLRDLILQKLRTSSTAGLGDEDPLSGPARAHSPGALWTAPHLAVLREIRDATRGLHSSGGRKD